MDEQKRWEQFAARFHGELDDDEKQQQLLAKEFGEQETIRQIFQARSDVRKIRQFQANGVAWELLRSKIVKTSRIKGFMRYAAVALIAVASTFFITQFAHENFTGTQFASVSSPTGQITNLTLFDGTNVWLNAGSTLKYKKTFNRSDREVYLEGEALFDVIKNEKQLFVVHTGNSDIKVHGTVFDVKAYSNMNTVETVLVEGSVEFTSKGKSAFLNPGEQLVFSKNTNRISKMKINTDEYTAWKGGKIYFNNKTLEDLVVQLERWYEVKFRFASEDFKNFRFSGVINRDRSLDYTLGIIEEINKVEFNANNDEIIITRKK